VLLDRTVEILHLNKLSETGAVFGGSLHMWINYTLHLIFPETIINPTVWNGYQKILLSDKKFQFFCTSIICLVESRVAERRLWHTDYD